MSEMDQGTRRRLVLGFVSNWISRLAGTIIQLVQVPVFLHFWSVTLYGDWLVVNAIPSYLSFSNIGFGSVAGNEMTMLMGRKDQQGALRVFQSCWWLIILLCSGVTALFAAALYLLPVAKWLNLNVMTQSDAKWVIFYLGTAVLFGQLEQLLQSAYTCVGKYPYATFVRSVLNLVAFAVMLVPVTLGYGPRYTALAFSILNAGGALFLGLTVRRDIPWLRFGWEHASMGELRRLTAPAIAFMGFPIGNALNLQGTLLAVGHVLGSTDVVVFATARTVSRVALQMVQMVNTTFWPELSSSFGAGNMPLVRSLHRRSCQLALGIAVVLIGAMMTVGPWFLSHWTAHKVPPSPRLLFLLLVSVALYSLWSTSSTLLAAINQHRRLSLNYVVATGVTIIATVFMAKRYGLLGAAASLILSELIMDVYVLPASLHISEDTWSGFLRSMLHIPASVRPQALLARLR
ncbi:MAG TPA: lipopolysaccharide biosynthesis protein [Acidobacteriaceae bacterium]|nr:lipopolysaccharide biosynthesis protein [Acidobacteriaceae bacterium]